MSVAVSIFMYLRAGWRWRSRCRSPWWPCCSLCRWCPPGTSQASGRQWGLLWTCTLPENSSEKSHCDWDSESEEERKEEGSLYWKYKSYILQNYSMGRFSGQGLRSGIIDLRWEISIQNVAQSKTKPNTHLENCSILPAKILYKILEHSGAIKCLYTSWIHQNSVI